MLEINLNDYIKDERKCYSICCTTAESWQYVHDILTQDGSIDDNIPSRQIEVADIQDHSETRAVYIMTDAEAAQLKNHPDIKFVEINIASYPNIPKPDPKELTCDRYATPRKMYNNYESPVLTLPSGEATSAELTRSGYQLLRCNQFLSPWGSGVDDQTILYSTIPNNTVTGKNIDVIVGDDGCWHGHLEFRNNLSPEHSPIDYVGGNKLPGNGSCDVLDLVLDSPYYIDPEWFDADPTTRLIKRWDGTIVPTDAEARKWWGLPNNRSPQFANIGTVGIDANYTRYMINGSDTNYPLNLGLHGTATAGQAFGRTHGWAYNANKWTVNVLDSYGLWPLNLYFDIVKIFHQNKPINPIYGTRDPTVCSNSWGFREQQANNHALTYYYYFRQGTSGTGGVQFAFGSNKPNFMNFLGTYGDSNRFKSELLTGTLTESGDELIQSGVIFVVAAGNSNQKLVRSQDPDYNNYWSIGNNVPFTSATHTSLDGFTLAYNSTSRRGFPQQIGKYTDGSGNVVYPVIQVGALDDNYTGGLESTVDYSDIGTDIDVFAPGDNTLSALAYPENFYGLVAPRYDMVQTSIPLTGTVSYVPGSFEVTGTGTRFMTELQIGSFLCTTDGREIGIIDSIFNDESCGLDLYDIQADFPLTNAQILYSPLASLDTSFGGTSSACPTAAGMIAAWMETNRSWTWQDVKNNINSLQIQSETRFLQGPDPSTPTSSDWNTFPSLQGGFRRVLYNNMAAPTQPESFTITGSMTISNGLTLKFT